MNRLRLMNPGSDAGDLPAAEPIGRPCRRRMAACALVLGVCTASVGAQQPPGGGEAYFAEPISGRRVTQYEVELPVERNERRRFGIPADCDAVMRALEEGATYKGTIIDRRLWQKVEADCRYENFLHRHPQQVIQDFVSGYDFMNADLNDLPIDQRCAGEDGRQCDPAATDGLGMLHHFPLAEPFTADGGQPAHGECVLRNGLFYGRMYVTPQGIRCDADARAPSLRLIAVDLADVNGDQVLDAVLRFVPIGPGAARSPLILPLTRNEPDTAFRVPEPAGGIPLLPRVP